MHLIRRSHNPEFIGKVKEALNTVKGGFAYLLMTEDKLIAALDPNGFRPLSIGQMKNGAWVVSSETCAFEVIGAKWVRDVKPGEIVIIDDNGISTTLTQQIRNWLFVQWNTCILHVQIVISTVSMSTLLVRIWGNVWHKNSNTKQIS